MYNTNKSDRSGLSGCSTGRNIVIEEPEDDEVLRTINITDILDNGDNFDDSSEIKLPKHQRCATHTSVKFNVHTRTLNLIATVDIQEAEKDGTYKVNSRRIFTKCQAIFNKQNQSSQCADKIKESLGRYLITPNATR